MGLLTDWDSLLPWLQLGSGSETSQQEGAEARGPCRYTQRWPRCCTNLLLP